MIPGVPLFGIVSRFTEQKGLDLVLAIVEALIELPAQLVILGDGALLDAAVTLARKHPRKIGMLPRFDEIAAHQIIAGADVFLMPSRVEPRGLSQMYAQRHGTAPIVSAVGGLVDTVDDLSTARATGFVFDKLSAFDLFAAVQKAVLPFKDRGALLRLQRNGIRKDFGWEKSARMYEAIYKKLKAGIRDGV